MCSTKVPDRIPYAVGRRSAVLSPPPTPCLRLVPLVPCDAVTNGSFRNLGIPYFGVLIIRILLFFGNSHIMLVASCAQVFGIARCSMNQSFLCD